MEESLRRAYLAAMDLPLWMPRAMVDAEEAARAAVEPPRAPLRVPVVRPGAVERLPADAAAIRGSGRAQAMLDGGPRVAPRTQAVETVARVPRGASSGGVSLALCFAHAGGTLFIDELPPAPAEARAKDLLQALAFVLERRRLEPRLQDFEWPPRGTAFDAAEARDAVLARIGKITAGTTLQRLVLMGAAPARLLLGWNEQAFAARGAVLQRAEAIDCPVLVTPAVHDMLQQPALKRLAWQTLRLATLGDG